MFLLIFVLSMLVLPIAAFADGPNPSPSGATHGAFANVNGNFGFLGELGGTPGYHGGFDDRLRSSTLASFSVFSFY